MGCDIACHIEVLLKDLVRNEWHHFSKPIINRDYTMFERIANVRSDIEDPEANSDCLIPPRGLPNDMSAVTRICYGHAHKDAHSMTWLTMGELCELIAWQESKRPLGERYQIQHREWGYFFGNDFRITTDTPSEIADIRLVCWFIG